MEPESVYVLGAGAIGMPLAVHLANAGRRVTAVRTSTGDRDPQMVEVTIAGANGKTARSVLEMVSLARLTSLPGIVVVAVKSYANDLIALKLREREVLGPVVIMQNGVGVEDPYLDLPMLRVYRSVIYATGQKDGDGCYTFIPITASPIGAVRGDVQELERLVGTLNTPDFPFTALTNIQQEVWKKATINAVFNSICPLLEVDNGIFVRDETAARLAREVVDECVMVMQRMGFEVKADDVMQQLLAISRRSDGQLISTLQDINHGRETEIEHLNLAIAHRAAAVAPEVKISTTKMLGEMVKIKSMLRKKR